jgi:ABC-type tungstate transport system permease subunit
MKSMNSPSSRLGKVLAAIALLFLAQASSVVAAIYYVATTGSDTNTGFFRFLSGKD